jgi:hypothetical protein
MSRGFKAATATFTKAGLPLPPIPSEFVVGLKEIEPWCFASRRVTGIEMYFFDRYLKEVRTSRVPAYVALSHAGHGINSYSLNYDLVVGSLALFAQVSWGGVYTGHFSEARQRLIRKVRGTGRSG